MFKCYLLKETKKQTIRLWVLGLMLVSGITANAQIIIQAEDYSDMKGIEIEATSDLGGGLNVGWIDNTDWMEYELDIPVAGEYKFTIRVAGEGSGYLKFLQSDVVLDSISVSSSGGWQVWKTVSSENTITLSSGVQTVKLLANPGGYNLNYWSLTLVSPVDTDKPTKPVVINSESTVHTISLSWNKSTDATSAVSLYKILNDDELFAMSSDTLMELKNVAPNKTFNLGIVAVDLAGNTSDTTELQVKTDTIPWKLQWSDEFDYTGAIDSEKWYFETGGHGWGNGEAQYYTNGDNAKVENGTLIIEARKETLGSNQFTSSRINNKQEFDFLYGRIEVKAKLPRTKGTWPAIWTLPTEWIYGGWPACGEIDIMEHSATYNYGYVFGTIHTGAYNHADGTQKGGGITFDDVSDTYHTYAIEWYPDHIDWYVDDIHIFRFDNEYKSTDEWPYDIPHHLLLNVAIGGGLGGDIDFNGVWPQQMVVDYVRVYDFELAENDTIAPDAPTGLKATPKDETIDLSWNLAKDNYAVKHYKVFLGSELVDSVAGTSATVQGLEPLTTYEIGICAEDFAGNKSAQVSATVTTLDVQAVDIPAKIEAEDFVAMEGIDTEDCEDDGGGINVGWIDSGDWMTYNINVPEAKEYRTMFRVASGNTGGTLLLLDAEGNELTSVTVPGTGDWQNWVSELSEPFNLEAGIQKIKVSTNTGGFNLNWLDIRGKDDFVNVIDEPNNVIRVYPNPFAGNELTIELLSDAANANVKFYSPDGKILYESEEAIGLNKIVLTDVNLSKGLYIMSVVVDKKVYTKVLKKQ